MKTILGKIDMYSLIFKEQVFYKNMNTVQEELEDKCAWVM